MEILNVLKVLLRKKWIIIFCGVAAALVAFLFTMNEKSKFEATAQMATGFTQQEALILDRTGFNPAQIDTRFNNTIEEITSDRVLNLVGYDLLMHDLQDPNPFRTPDPSATQAVFAKTGKLEIIRALRNARDSVRSLSAASEAEQNAEKLMDIYGYSAGSLEYMLSAKRFERTDYINISATSENPVLSAFAANALVHEFQLSNIFMRRTLSAESSVGLDSTAAAKKDILDQKIAAKTAYLNDSMTSSLDPSVVGASQLSQISTNEANLASARARKSSLTYQIAQYQAQLKGLASTGAGTNTQNSEYSALRKRRQQLFEEYIKTNSTDEALKKQLDDLDQQMKDRVPTSTPIGNADQQANLKNSLTQSLTNAQAELEEVNSQINYYETKLYELRSGLGSTAAPRVSARLEQLEAEINVAQQEYNDAAARSSVATNLGAVSPISFRQSIVAQPPSKPVPSKRMLIVLFAGIAGITLAAMVFIFRELFDTSIKTSSQFGRLTDGLPLMGSVNLVDFDRKSIKEQVVSMEQSDEGKNRSNRFRELLRKLRYEIETSGKRVILFTSTEPQQGKTTLCQALAYSLSLSGKKVLIIDTNFCNNDITVYNEAQPSLEKFAGSMGHPLMANSLGNGLVSKTGVEGIDIIGCNGGDYSPSEVLKGDHLLKHTEELLNIYDYVFMEGAPLNGFTDSRELAEYADGVIAIFSAKTHIKHSDRTSIEFLKSLNGKFLGAVLNKVERQNISQ